jgi:hypothetical protein
MGWLLCSCPGHSQVNLPPTATEIFHLRGECYKLGNHLLAVNVWDISQNKSKSQISHYNPLLNMCFVTLIVKGDDFHNVALYDGQSGELLSIVGVATMGRLVSRHGESMTNRPASQKQYEIDKNSKHYAYDVGCGYINDMIKSTTSCNALDALFAQLLLTHKAIFEQ